MQDRCILESYKVNNDRIFCQKQMQMINENRELQIYNQFKQKLYIILAQLQSQLRLWKKKVKQLQSNIQSKENLNSCLLSINGRLLKQNKKLKNTRSKQQKYYYDKILNFEQVKLSEKKLTSQSSKEYQTQEKCQKTLTKNECQELILLQTTFESHQPKDNPEILLPQLIKATLFSTDNQEQIFQISHDKEYLCNID